MEFLIALRCLVLALWLGGLVTIDFVEAPARFRAVGVDRNHITAIGRSVFKFFNRYELGLSLLLLALTILSTGLAWNILATCILLAATLFQFFGLRPRMNTLGEQLNFVNRDPTDPRYRQLRGLHNMYVVFDLVKLAGLLWLFFQSV